MAQMYDNKDQEVEISEQGTMLMSLNTNSTIDGSPLEIDVTVPTGKKWILKGIVYRTTGGTTTRGIISIRDGSDSFEIKDASESQASYTFLFGNNIPQITLKPGIVIRYSAYYSADPTTQTLKLLVQEIDL